MSVFGNISVVSLKISKYNKDTNLDTTRNERGRFMKRRRCAPWILQRYGQRYFLRYVPFVQFEVFLVRFSVRISKTEMNEMDEMLFL